MLQNILIFLSSFIFIGLKSTQQLNVVYRQYWWIVPTSMAMATVEVFVVVNAAKNGWSILLVLLIGVGSGLGSLCATYLHSQLVKKDIK